MILSDNETAVDLLNKGAMVDSIVDVICDKPNKPKTMGVYGDWGSGKSSILEMVENKLSDKDRTMCIKFNGWRFQGFGDAKISIIEGIVKELINEQSLFTRAKEETIEILKQVDLLKAARLGSNLFFNLATGMPSYEQLMVVLKGSNYGEFVNNLNVLRDRSDVDKSNKLPQEINEFLNIFETLLEKADIDHLVVLIDDLDRCLPKFVIETLEAVRLFLFANRTVFIIAVDEALVELSVGEHFPQKSDSSLSSDYARKYLEKLIQLPFHISDMNDIEIQNYVSLLLFGEELGEEHAEFQNLIGINNSSNDSQSTGKILDHHAVKALLESDKVSKSELLSKLDKIAPIIAEGTKGNPRLIKRFLNSLILLREIAFKGGYLDSLDLQILTKLLLAEQFHVPLFHQIADSVIDSPDGRCMEFEILEQAVEKTQSPEFNPQVDKKISTPDQDKLSDIRKPKSPNLEIWASEESWNWLKLEPALANIDLMRYIRISNLKRTPIDQSRNSEKNVDDKN